MAGYNPPLTFNLSSSSWVKSAAYPVAANPPKWIFGDTKTLKFTLVEDVLSGGGVQIVKTITSLALSFSASAGSTVLTSATASGPDAAYAWTAVLSFSVVGIQALKGTQGVLEFFLGGVDRYQAPINVLDQVSSGALTPTPAPDTQLGQNAAKGIFMLKDAQQEITPGQTWRIERSPSGQLWKVSRNDAGSEDVEPLI